MEEKRRKILRIMAVFEIYGDEELNGYKIHKFTHTKRNSHYKKRIRSIKQAAPISIHRSKNKLLFAQKEKQNGNNPTGQIRRKNILCRLASFVNNVHIFLLLLAFLCYVISIY